MSSGVFTHCASMSSAASGVSIRFDQSTTDDEPQSHFNKDSLKLKPPTAASVGDMGSSFYLLLGE